MKSPVIGVLIHLQEVPDFQAHLTKIRIETTSLGANLMVIVDHTQYHTASYFHTDDIKVHIFNTLEAAEAHFAKLPKIYLEPLRVSGKLKSTPLPKLKHPPSCLYITGPNTASIPTTGREKATWAHIPMATPNGVFYAETALVLALYDRLVKTKS